jgi:hypothetical protein
MGNSRGASVPAHEGPPGCGVAQTHKSTGDRQPRDRAWCRNPEVAGSTPVIATQFARRRLSVRSAGFFNLGGYMEALIVGFLFGQVVAYLVARSSLNRWRDAASFQADVAARAGVDLAAARTEGKLLRAALQRRDQTIAGLEAQVRKLDAERASAIAGELAAEVEAESMRKTLAGLRERIADMRGELDTADAGAEGG